MNDTICEQDNDDTHRWELKAAHHNGNHADILGGLVQCKDCGIIDHWEKEEMMEYDGW